MLDRVMNALTRRMSKLSARMDKLEPALAAGPVHSLADSMRAEGNRYLEVGEWAQAKACFEQGLKHQPENIDLLVCMGFTLKEEGHWLEAQGHLQRAYALAQGQGPAWEIAYLLGQIHEALGQMVVAQVQYSNVTRLRPQFVGACADLLRLYRQSGRDGEIPAVLLRAIQAAPEVPEYREWLGVDYLFKKKNLEALEQFDAQLLLQPDSPEVLSNRGLALEALGRHDDALDAYTRALNIAPNLAQGYSNRAAIFKHRGDTDRALQDLHHASSLSPMASIPHCNLGEVYRDRGDLDKAVYHYDLAIELEPQDPTAYWNKSMVLLLQGELEKGFAMYEYRWNMFGASRPALTGIPWLGAPDLAGKTIIIYCEQGLGDTIQFSRYVPLLTAKGANVIFQVQSALVSLFDGVIGMGQVVPQGRSIGVADFHCPVMSLPLAFQTGLHSIPSSENYLTVEESRLSAWATRLGRGVRPRVGIVWSGNAAHKSDHLRSLSLAQLVTCLPSDWEWVSLQKEVRPGDLETLKALPQLRHFGSELQDFKDTAALCRLMDVVVCVDTSVAHLSAALGCPTWVLLHEVNDWRWMTEREDSPWYPSMRLFRRKHGGDWSDPLQAIAKALTDIAV